MRVYFMGIGGTAMGNVALMLRRMGYDVCGADAGLYPPMSTQLAASDIEIHEGYDAGRLAGLKPDLVVVGNVISRGNPEIEWLLETEAFPYVSMPELLRSEVLKARKSIVVTGTHGKTTTSTIAATLLDKLGQEPGYLIGGVPHDLPGGAAPGKAGAPFVIEGDEYDSAFFDKRSKFIHYRPHILILNNIEFDHADIFRDLEDVLRTFRHLVRLVPRNGFILANGDDPQVTGLLALDWCRIYTVGTGEKNDLRITHYAAEGKGSRFHLEWQGRLWAEVKWPMQGLFNARNAAMAALGSALAIAPETPASVSLEALNRFGGVKRRQELLHEDDHTVVIEDFGHHPGAIAQTLKALRERYGKARLIACFEPRSNTARTQVFQETLPKALAEADQVMIGALHRADKLPPEKRLDVDAICEELEKRDGVIAHAYGTNQLLLEAALHEVESGKEAHPRVFCFFSNGSFDGVMSEFVESLKAPGR